MSYIEFEFNKVIKINWNSDNSIDFDINFLLPKDSFNYWFQYSMIIFIGLEFE